jgi:hypothetical protein
MFSSENGPDIEMVSNASEFLVDTLNIWDNGHVLAYFFLWGGTKSLGTAATSVLLYKPQMIVRVIVEQLVE